MHLPDSFKKCFTNELLYFQEAYVTSGNGGLVGTDHNFSLYLGEDCTEQDIWNLKWQRETYRFDLYNEHESVKVIYHGI